MSKPSIINDMVVAKQITLPNDVIVINSFDHRRIRSKFETVIMSLDVMFQNQRDINPVEKFVPDVFKSGILYDVLQIDGVVLAGGAIRDTLQSGKPKDYDIFFTELEAKDQVVESIRYQFERIAKTHYTETYVKIIDQEEVKIQLVFKKVYNGMSEIIYDFDFSNVMFAINKNGVAIGHNTIKDHLNMRVGINCISKPLSSLNRLQKYVDNYNVNDAYKYIVSLLQTTPPGLVLNASYYNGDEGDED